MWNMSKPHHMQPFAVFDRLFNGWPFQCDRALETPASFAPAVDVVETDTEYTVTADLPGMKRENIDLSITGKTLVLTGERKSETEGTQGSYKVSERSYGKFVRQIPLRDDVVFENIEASFRDGVLTVAVPKSIDAQINNRTIEIKDV